jgi:hypothetical protein
LRRDFVSLSSFLLWPSLTLTHYFTYHSFFILVRLVRAVTDTTDNGNKDTAGKGNASAVGLPFLVREGRCAPRTSCAQVASPASTVSETWKTGLHMRHRQRKTERQTHRWSSVRVAPVALRVRGGAHDNGVLRVGDHHATVRTVVADVPAIQPAKERARTTCLLSCWPAKKG